MESQTSSEISFPANPWSKVPIHPLTKALALCDQNGSLLSPDAAVEEEYDKTPVAETLRQLRNLSNASSDIRNIRGQIRDITFYGRSRDLTTADALQNKLDNVRQLLTDLESAVKNQPALTRRLQQPCLGTCLTIEAKHHANAVSCFEKLAFSISSLQEQCDVLKWHTTNGMRDDKMQSTLHNVTKAISNLEQRVARLK